MSDNKTFAEEFLSPKAKRLYQAEPLQFKEYPVHQSPIAFSTWESQECDILAHANTETKDEWIKYFGEPMDLQDRSP